MRVPLGFVLLFIAAAAQSHSQPPGKGTASESSIAYNSATELSIYGRVTEVRERDAPPTLKGIHVSLDVDGRLYQIYVCPAPFLKSFDITLQKGDGLQIKGSRIKFEGSELILARQLRKQNDVLELRDAKGNPYWEDERLRRTLTWNRPAGSNTPAP